MSQINNHINVKLNSLCSLAENKEADRNDVLDAFDDFLNEFVKLGHYSVKQWPIQFTSVWWEKFVALSKTQHLGYFLNKLSNKIADESTSSDQREPLEYLTMELRWGQNIGNIDYKAQGVYISNLLEKYPYNIEILYAYSHVLRSNIETQIEAYEKYRQCFEAWGGTHLTN